MDEFKNVDEVIMIIGPNYDVRVKIINEDDDEEGSDRFIIESIVPHVKRKDAFKENVMCIVVPVEERDRKFIMDSGSGHDLISKKKVERLGLEDVPCDPIAFHTANGVTVAQQEVNIDLGTIEGSATAQVLDDTPSVFAMGERCVHEGYSFVWPSSGEPFMIDKHGKRINMIVRDLIPYIHLGLPECDPHDNDVAKEIHEVLRRGNHRPPDVMYLDGESGDEVKIDMCDPSSKNRKIKVKKKRSITHPAMAGELEDEEAIIDDPIPYPPDVESEAGDDGAISDWDLGMDPEEIELEFNMPLGDDAGYSDYEPEFDDDVPREDEPRVKRRMMIVSMFQMMMRTPNLEEEEP